MMDTSVVEATTLTDNSTSRLNFAENIVVVAAVGAALAIIKATIIVLSTQNKTIANSATAGIKNRRTAIAMYPPMSVNACLKSAFDR